VRLDHLLSKVTMGVSYLVQDASYAVRSARAKLEPCGGKTSRSYTNEVALRSLIRPPKAKDALRRAAFASPCAIFPDRAALFSFEGMGSRASERPLSSERRIRIAWLRPASGAVPVL